MYATASSSSRQSKLAMCDYDYSFSLIKAGVDNTLSILILRKKYFRLWKIFIIKLNYLINIWSKIVTYYIGLKLVKQLTLAYDRVVMYTRYQV